VLPEGLEYSCRADTSDGDIWSRRKRHRSA
jgi:hypothetical protein